MNDEEFAASLRPDNTFGVAALSDYFDEDDVPQQADASWEPPSYQGVANTAFAGPPMAVSGALAPTQSAPSNSKLGAAITLFCILAGAGLGWKYGGFKGAAGGAITGGALRNLYRAQKSISTDTMGAVKQGIVGAVGVAGGGYLLWTARK